MREHNEAVNRLDVIERRERDHGRLRAGRPSSEVTQHDGSVLTCASSRPTTIRPTALGALAYLQERQAAGEIVTGLLYVDPTPRTCTTG